MPEGRFVINLDIKPSSEILYHYTSHEALYSIVESRALRASHVYYMNDSNEIKFAVDRFISIIKNNIENESDALRLNFLNQIPNWIQNIRNEPHFIFVFSLSKNGNLLSQWRAYTPHGTGISIGFAQSDLETYANKNNLSLVECIYDNDQQNTLLQETLLSILSKFDLENEKIETNHRAKGQEYFSYLFGFTEQLLKVFVRIKDPAFKEECEWRLISNYYEKYTNPDINFRSGLTTLIPYINFKIENIRPDNYLFDRVYVGPSPNFGLAFSAISAYLNNKHACRMTVSSRQPYRHI